MTHRTWTERHRDLKRSLLRYAGVTWDWTDQYVWRIVKVAVVLTLMHYAYRWGRTADFREYEKIRSHCSGITKLYVVHSPVSMDDVGYICVTQR